MNEKKCLDQLLAKKKLLNKFTITEVDGAYKLKINKEKNIQYFNIINSLLAICIQQYLILISSKIIARTRVRVDGLV